MLDWSQTHAFAAQPAAPACPDATGLLIGTRIATAIGWRDVAGLCVGDQVLTFDNGFQTIAALRRETLWDGQGPCPAHLCPLVIADDLLPDVRNAQVLPSQGLLVESDYAESHRGDPFAVILPWAMRAADLAVSADTSGPIDVIRFEFAQDQVVYGESGLHFHVPATFALGDDLDAQSAYKLLDADETQTVLDEFYAAYLWF